MVYMVSLQAWISHWSTFTFWDINSQILSSVIPSFSRQSVGKTEPPLVNSAGAVPQGCWGSVLNMRALQKSCSHSWGSLRTTSGINKKKKKGDNRWNVMFQQRECYNYGTAVIWANQNQSSLQFSHSVVSDSLRPHESQHTRPPCPSPPPGVHPDSRPLSQ